MNVISVVNEVGNVANPMIGESALPDFALAAKDRSEGMGVAALDQLDGMLQRDVLGRSQQ